MAREIALKDLDERQLLFVTYYIDGGSGEDAARRAGYAESTSKGWRHALLVQPHIAYAIALGVRRALADSAPMALKTLKDLAEKAESEKVRADCARALLDRAGFVAPRATIAPGKDEKPLHEQSTDELQTLAARLESELAGRAKPVSSATAAPQVENDVDLIG
jgi:hypothetical protein